MRFSLSRYVGIPCTLNDLELRSKAWVVQRKEVDGFYGGFFEGDFQLLQYMLRAKQPDYFTDPKLFGAVRPKILYGDKEIKYFLRQGEDRRKPPPTGFQIVELEVNGCVVELNVRASPEQMLATPSRWIIETKKDLRIPAFVSLIKAAHLSIFSVLGYRYVLSNAGRFVGQDILGRFYRENSQIRIKRATQELALTFFRPYKHMVRPMLLDSTTMEGTLTDGMVSLYKAPAICLGA